MTIESVTYIDDLDPTYPAATDNKSEGDDHIRNLKTGITATFPNISGAVTPTHTELNYVDGVTSAIQTQLDAKAALGGATFTGAVILSSTLAANGGVTLGDAAGDALTINSSAVTCANGINFDSNTLIIDASNNVVRLGIASTVSTAPLQVGSTSASALGITVTGRSADNVSIINFKDNSGATEMARIQVAATNDMLFGIGSSATEAARFDASRNFVPTLRTTPPTLAANSQMVFNLTSNTNLRISVRGSDGTTRVANITLV